MTKGKELEKEIKKVMENFNSGNMLTTQVIAKVETAPPGLTLRFSEQLIPSEQIYCSNYLLPHYHRDYTIDGIVDNIELTTREISGTLGKFKLSNSTSTSAAGEGPHTHAVPTISGSGSFESKGDGTGAIKGNGIYRTHGDIWFEDTLKPGDEVLVNIVGVYWVVVSKITKMPAGAEEGV